MNKELNDLKEAIDKMGMKIEEDEKKCLELERQGKLNEAKAIYEETAKNMKDLKSWVARIEILISNRSN